MTLQNISVIRGDTCSFNLIFKDSNKDPIDLTGWTIYFTIRKFVASSSIRNDDCAVFSKQITTGDDTGIIAIDLTSRDTNIEPEMYKYDIQYKKPDGTTKSTSIYEFEILEDITRSD